MNPIKKTLFLSAIIFLTSPILACPKKMTPGADEKQAQPSNDLHLATKKIEEDALRANHQALIAQRAALLNKKEKASFIDTPALTAEQNQLNEAFAQHRAKAEKLSAEIDALTDLNYRSWQENPYWNSVFTKNE